MRYMLPVSGSLVFYGCIYSRSKTIEKNRPDKQKLKESRGSFIGQN